MHIRGHNLFWAVDGGYQIPDWIKSLQGEDMKEAIDHRISTAVTHYDVKNSDSQPGHTGEVMKYLSPHNSTTHYVSDFY